MLQLGFLSAITHVMLTDADGCISQRCSSCVWAFRLLHYTPEPTPPHTHFLISCSPCMSYLNAPCDWLWQATNIHCTVAAICFHFSLQYIIDNTAIHLNFMIAFMQWWIVKVYYINWSFLLFLLLLSTYEHCLSRLIRFSYLNNSNQDLDISCENYSKSSHCLSFPFLS
jgi:hypothetical protein